MADSPIKTVGSVVRCTLYSQQTKVSDRFRLVSLNTYQAVNRIGKALLVFELDDIEQGHNDDTFAPGKNIRVELGYDHHETPVFEGLVLSLNVRITAENRCSLQVECRDYAFRSTQNRTNRVFVNTTDSEAIKSILGAYAPLSPEVEATSVQHPELVQYYSTDWEFVLLRAQANGLTVATRGQTVCVEAPRIEAAPSLSLTYGVDMIECTCELSLAEQFGRATATAWDPAAQKVVQGGASGNPSGPECTLQTVAASGSEELRAWARSTLLWGALSRIRGTVRFAGCAQAVHGQTMALDGLGARLNGKAYMGAVEHQVQDGEWTTTVELGLPAQQPDDPRDAAALVPRTEGLHIGKVVKLQDDPAGEHRVQVELPLLGTKNNRVWARISTFWSSDGYGAFVVPDVGDEVALGFFNNDPRYPVLLGSLYSSKQKPPYELTPENYTHALVTKSQMVVAFDDQNKEITLYTPGKNTLTISDRGKGIRLSDQNNNVVETNDKGIALRSSGDITIKSDKNITLEAGAAFHIKAATDLKIKGLNIEAKADASLKALGTASAELSASGQTTVKGAMVLIN